MDASKPEGWVLVDPKEPLPCSLGVVVPEFRVDELRRLEQEERERSFLVRAVLSDHVPLAGSMAEILNRPSHHRVAVNDQLSIYLHHGGRNAVYFDLIGAGPEGWLHRGRGSEQVPEPLLLVGEDRRFATPRLHDADDVAAVDGVSTFT